MASDDKRRIFVGGLFPEISEEDVREKFQSFGEIKNVQIVRKKDLSGNISKTFAYIDIICEESSYSKCVNIFNKSRWKGNQMSIQLAKESFLTKLDKERSVSEESERSIIEIKSPEHERRLEELAQKVKGTKNIPGTRVPGENKWVIGKYGVILPIVNVKDEARRKMLKHDPSSHCHCIKRFKDNTEDHAVSVDSLSWVLKNSEDAECSLTGTDSVKNKKTKSEDSERSDGATNLGKKARKKKLKAKSHDSKEREDRGSSSHKAIMKKEEAKTADSHPSLSFDESKEITVHNDEEIFSNKKTANDKGNNSNLSNGQNDNHSALGCDSQVNGLSSTIMEQIRKRKNTSDAETMDTNKGASNYKTSSCVNDQETPVGMSQLLSQPRQLIVSLNDLSSAEEVKDTKDTNGLTTTKLASPLPHLDIAKCKHGGSTLHNLEEKALLSEQKRLESIQKLQTSIQKQQKIIRASLKNVDKEVKTQQHITFSDHETDESDNAVENTNNSHVGIKGSQTSYAPGKVSAKASLSWLGLDEDDDDDKEQPDETVNEMIPFKSHFEGEKGHKLFKLQQAIGSDARFQLGQKFLESESEGEDEPSGEKQIEKNDIEDEVTNNEDIDEDLKNERDRSMKILQGILGSTVVTASSKKSSFKSTGPVHFDPTDESHKEYEMEVDASDSPENLQSSHKDTDEKKNKNVAIAQLETADEPPDVSTDRYYDVSTSLKSLFGDEGGKGFSFLLQGDDENTPKSKKDDKDTQLPKTTTQVEDARVKRPDWMTSLSAETEIDDDCQPSDAHSIVIRPPKKHRFFYQANDERLSEANTDGSALFMRTETEEEIINYWTSVRKRFTEDYKRKHRDAVRWRKKMSAKAGKRQ